MPFEQHQTITVVTGNRQRVAVISSVYPIIISRAHVNRAHTTHVTLMAWCIHHRSPLSAAQLTKMRPLAVQLTVSGSLAKGGWLTFSDNDLKVKLEVAMMSNVLMAKSPLAVAQARIAREMTSATIYHTRSSVAMRRRRWTRQSAAGFIPTMDWLVHALLGRSCPVSVA